MILDQISVKNPKVALMQFFNGSNRRQFERRKMLKFTGIRGRWLLGIKNGKLIRFQDIDFKFCTQIHRKVFLEQKRIYENLKLLLEIS